MPERPLLLFPTPRPAERTRQKAQFGRVHRPDPARQGVRLSPMFNQLQQTFAARKVELQQTIAGIEPEQVLVIETVNGVADFAKAVKLIDGMEWMGELEGDEIIPDQDFFYERDPSKTLDGRLYFVMTNQRALDEMLSLWKRYQVNPSMEFERGLTKFRDVFLHLKTIRRWDVQDRLLETGLLESWRESVERDAARVVRFEAELWFRSVAEGRQSGQSQVARLVQELGGRVLSQSVIESIAYHGLLGELPVNAVRGIVDNPATELVKCESVMYFRPVGQICVGHERVEGEPVPESYGRIPMPSGEPLVALLDGVSLGKPPIVGWSIGD